jgi:hypothetical protein
MQVFKELMDCVKAAQNGRSDYWAAYQIGTVPTSIYSWRSGRRNPAHIYVFRLANLAKSSPAYWLARFEAERADDDNLSQCWENIAAANCHKKQ